MTTAWGPPRLIALDIDGTIIGAGRPASPRVLTGIRNALASGVHVVLATGRAVFSTLPVLTELGLTAGQIVCSNGAVRLDTASGEYLAVHRFDAAPLAGQLRELLPGASFAVEQLGAGHMVTGAFPGVEIRPDQFVDHAALVVEPITRLTAYWEGHSADELAARVSGLELAGVSYMLDRDAPWLVAVTAGVSKGSALEQLRVELEVPANATLAVGDGDNDVEMLRWAEWGVAMGNAPESVKAAAREVTGSIDDDGLAAVLERWF